MGSASLSPGGDLRALWLRFAGRRSPRGGLPEMGQLVWVVDRMDRGDLTVGDLQCQYADQLLLGVEGEHARAAVHFDPPERQTRDLASSPAPVGKCACNACASPQRTLRCHRLAAAVAGQLNVRGKQRLEPGEVALLGGGEE